MMAGKWKNWSQIRIKIQISSKILPNANYPKI